MGKLVKLFELGKIGTMEIKNRIVLAPLGLRPLTTEPGGYPTEQFMAFYEARAKGGVGLIQLTTTILSGLYISGPFYAAGTLSILDDEHIPSAQRVVQALKTLGTKVSFSLTNHGIRISEALERRPPETHPELLPVVGPSATRHPLTGRVAQPLMKEEIHQMVEEFGQGARRGKMTGFDAIRIQGCHGYLIGQFLSKRTNKRTDEYGGSLENRCRFACDIIRRVRKEVGPDFPIIFRMNGDDYLEEGITLEEAVEQAPLFVEAGADALDISAGPRESHHWQFVTMYHPSGALVHLAAAIKRKVNVPVIAAGKIGPLLAEQILQEGSADFIHMARPLIADPDLPNKAREGSLDDIRPCIYCNQCKDRPGLIGVPGCYCAVNPAAGKEWEYALRPAERRKRVMVIGGGLAGMEAARTLAERGHDTNLYEASDRLGGQWNIISSCRADLADLTRYLAGGLEKVGGKVFLNKRVTAQMVQEAKPDAVIVAIGATPVVPDVPGVHGKNVVLAIDVLTGKANVGEEVVIIGGRLVGLDTALFLAERGKKVSVVEMRKIAWGVGSTLKLALMEKMIEHGVHLYPDSTLERVTENGVNVIWDGGDSTTRRGERYELLFLKADTVVLAVGSKSESGLAEELRGLMSGVYSIGDCVEPRDVLAAIHEGAAVGCKI